MADLIYRLDPEGRDAPRPPADARAARDQLLAGNKTFIEVFRTEQIIHVAPSNVGIESDDTPIPQRPFASVLGCADARVPIELVFGCGSNQLFVVRVAGNVPGDECLGSLEYATENLADSLRLTVVLGHTGCGAVGAAIDAYRDPRSYPSSGMLRAVVDRILPAVRTADRALVARHGAAAMEGDRGRDALAGAAVVLNAALAAMTVREALGIPIEFGVFDLSTRRTDLAPPPEDMDAFLHLATELAAAGGARRALDR